MFGRTIWKSGRPTVSLREVAFTDVQAVHGAGRGAWSRSRSSPRGESALRLAQASWAMMHGLCRLKIDGIYIDAKDLDAMSEEAVRLVVARLGR
jgi:hypothetical protein